MGVAASVYVCPQQQHTGTGQANNGDNTPDVVMHDVAIMELHQGDGNHFEPHVHLVRSWAHALLQTEAKRPSAHVLKKHVPVHVNSR